MEESALTKKETTAAPAEPEAETEAGAAPPAETETTPTDPKKSRRIPFIIGGVLLVAALGGVIYWLYARQYESTDDAFIEGNVVQISPKVAAYVKKVYVSENQFVHKGELLVELDSADYEVRRSQAQAQLGIAQAQRNQARANVALTRQTTQASQTQAASNVQTARNNVRQTNAGANAKRDSVTQAKRQMETAQATLNQARAQIPAAEATLAQVQAQVPAAEANLQLARADFTRYQNLYRNGDVPAQRADQANVAVRAAQAQYDAARKQVDAASAQLNAVRQQAAVAQSRIGETSAIIAGAEDNYRQSLAQIDVTKSQVSESAARLQDANAAPERIAVNETQVGSAEAQISQAAALVTQADLDLSYTKIYAPEDGYVTRKNVQEGQLVQPGQAVLALAQQGVWVVANFKETQLAAMRVGQAVDIHVDAYSGQTFHGRIDSFQAGTGSRFSVLPPENATGNFVKVVQRVPVKIVFDGDPNQARLLVPGMSVQPKVKVR